MSNNLMENLLNSVEKISPGFSKLLEQGMDFVPYIGRMYTNIKINRLQRRLNEHDEKLKKISMLSSYSKLSNEYITERIFPIVLGDLIEEHEDAKILLILNGFENVFIEENSQESVVISYFDTLRSLRYADVVRLLYLAGRKDSYPLPIIESDEHALIRNIDAKLKSLGLIGDISGFRFDASDKEEDTNKDDIIINLYCKKFLDFISDKES